jgi:hypothetical protein
MPLIDQWLRDEKPIEKLIVSPMLETPPPTPEESDIYDYGVQHILIVQRPELVDLIVMNNQHAEHGMLVLSEDGYPGYLMDQARRVLQEQPEMPIHILHDADSVGRTMSQRLNQLDVPIEGREIIDLGFSPDDFKRMKRFQNVDRKNKSRELEADVLATPFLATGLAACFATELTMSQLIDEHTREAAAASSYSSFG